MWLAEKKRMSAVRHQGNRGGHKDNIGGCKLLAGSSDANGSSDVNYSSRQEWAKIELEMKKSWTLKHTGNTETEHLDPEA